MPIPYPIVNLYQIKELLVRSGSEVFTTKDISRILGMDPPASRVYIHRMMKKGLLTPIQRGIYSITDDPFVIASQIEQPSYLSYSTALYLHGRYSQVIDVLYIANSGRTRKLEFQGQRTQFIHLDGRMMYGYRKEPKGKSYMALADLEKAVIDVLCRPRYLPIAECYTALVEGFDQNLLEEYAILSGSEAVIRRAGYLIESLGVETTISPSTETVYKLNPSLKKKGTFDPKWKLYINEVF